MKQKNNPQDPQKDTTFLELLSWLYQRSKRRRRYLSDTVRREKRMQVLTSLLYLGLLSLLLIPVMSHALLQRQDTLTEETVLFEPSAAAANPLLSEDRLTCEIGVQIGTDPRIHMRSDAATVGDLLSRLGISAGADDIIRPDADTLLTSGMEIDVIRVTWEESLEVAAIPYETVYIDCQTIPRGTTSRISYGTDGVAEQLQRRRYENGVLAETIVLSSETKQEPVSESFYRGVGGYVSGVDGTFSYSYYMDVTATYYGGYAEERLTYTGTVAREGVIAVDPTVIPLKSKVYVKGDYGDYGVCSADDIGGGIKGRHIDIFMDADRETLMEYGFREMRVYFLD